MGLINIQLTIKNPKDERRSIKKEFLVDSGANYTVLPERDWKKLKLKPEWKQKFSLADGRVVIRKIGNALVEFKNRKSATPVVLGKKGDYYLAGAITLEALGLSFDPFQRKIYQSKLMLANLTSTN